jgi:poly(A) polymerase Pap1
VVVQSEAKVTPSSPEKRYPCDQLIIENQYCLRRGQELVKVTFIRIGGEVITLTDRLRLAQDPSEEEEKTKSSSTSTTNSPLELHPSSRHKSRKNYLSNNAKEILSLFEKWLHRHHS